MIERLNVQFINQQLNGFSTFHLSIAVTGKTRNTAKTLAQDTKQDSVKGMKQVLMPPPKRANTLWLKAPLCSWPSHVRYTPVRPKHPLRWQLLFYNTTSKAAQLMLFPYHAD